MTSGSFVRNLRRSVSPLELFFDLVFAVGRLAHPLYDELSWRGAAETAVMLIAVLFTWALTSFDATFLDVERPLRHRLVLVVRGLDLCLALAAGGIAAVWLPPLVSVLILALILVTLVTAPKRVHQRVLTTMTAGT